MARSVEMEEQPAAMTSKTATATRHDRQLLKDRVALVTGASRGVGKGIALELARAGCAVAVNYKSDRAGAARTVSEIRALGGTGFHVQADVSSSTQLQRMFDNVLHRSK